MFLTPKNLNLTNIEKLHNFEDIDVKTKATFVYQKKCEQICVQKNRKIDTLTTDHQNCSRSLLGTSLVHSQTAIRDQAIIINCIRGPPYWEIYSSKLQNVFVQILKIICIRDQAIIINCIRGPYWKIYSSKLQNVFVQILKTICLYCIGYLSKFQIVFVKISTSMCPNCKKI